MLAACAIRTAEGGTADDGTEEQELVVSAAASLRDAFGELGAAFEEANPGVTVSFNFGPSDGLAT